MPDCPDCNVMLALSEIGVICPQCRKHITPMELHDLPDYQFQHTYSLMMNFLQLMDAGLIDNQLYYVEITFGGIGVLPLGITHN